MDWIDKLERRWGRYGIPNLINILLAGQLITGIIALVFNAGVLFDLLLFRDAVLHGQIWQLITFLFYPTWIGGFLGILNLFFYFWLGNSLTRYWGDFRMTLFIALGMVGCWLGAFLMGVGTSGAIFQSLVFAYCWLWPDQGVLLMGIIPFKMKYLGWLELAYWAWAFLRAGSLGARLSMILGLAGFLAFFGRELFDWCRDAISGYKRRRDWENRNRR